MGLFSIFSKDKKESLTKGLEKTKESVFLKLSRAVAGKSKVDDDDDDEDVDEKDDDWEKPEEGDDDWDPDFDEFDIPKSKGKKAAVPGKKKAEEEDDFKIDEDFKEFDLFNDKDEFDDEEDDF